MQQMTVMEKEKTGRRRIVEHGRYLHGAALGTLGVCMSWAVNQEHGGREWVEVNKVDLHLKGLPAGLVGKRIVHISDLHLSRTVTASYLHACVTRINLLGPDIVVITGDYVTYDSSGKYRERAAEIASRIDCPYGVYACLGNHDYGAVMKLGPRCAAKAESVRSSLENRGICVLQNESVRVNIEGSDLWLVGLGDIWVGDLNPERAFEGIPDGETVIALAHNPRSIDHLHPYPVDLLMSGHTHGAQIRWRVSGGLSRKARRFHSGMYEVEGKKLYVNRGLGRLGRARLNAPPEITVVTLRG